MEIPDLPWISTSQMVEVDRLMVEDFGISLIQMMENAGRHLARLAVRRFLEMNPAGKSVVILAGSGGNGGGALAGGRNLKNWGCDIKVHLTKPREQISKPTSVQAGILEGLGVDLANGLPEPADFSPDLIIDGVIGYSLDGPPRGRAAELIRWANRNGAPIISLDMPSGVDASTGEVYSPAINADATLTLALPKIGLRIANRAVVGELYLADIGVPPVLYRHLGLKIGPIFAEDDILRLL